MPEALWNLKHPAHLANWST